MLKVGLTEQDFQDAANQLGVDVPTIKAVAEVESGPHGAFLSSGEPVILFERHKFHKLTGGKFSKFPDISNPKAGGLRRGVGTTCKTCEGRSSRSRSCVAVRIMGKVSSLGDELGITWVQVVAGIH